ncbi:MAG: hypothetical protein NTZ71_13650 [Planctomycetota bacterium]|nr:hypothetical protein [Planctomycetota bacterium]
MFMPSFMGGYLSENIRLEKVVTRASSYLPNLTVAWQARHGTHFQVIFQVGCVGAVAGDG